MKKLIKKAKEALNLNVINFTIPLPSFKSYIHRYILSKWQSSRDNAIFNKLHEVRSEIKKDYPVVESLRREDVVLTRLRIGHTRMTHSLKRDEQPHCISCNEPFTIKHFLLDCVHFLDIRKQYFNVRNLKQLFSEVHVNKISSYLFNKI